MEKKHRNIFLVAVCVMAGISWFVWYDQIVSNARSTIPLPSIQYGEKQTKLVNSTKEEIDLKDGPWGDTPKFALYVRFSSSPRWESEYKNVLLRTMKIFFPQEKVKLLVVLDNEKPQDHDLGARLTKEWPYPEICYRDPGNPAVYRNWGKARMFWDMMFPDACTNLPYVGYIDTDTFFDTYVTPNLLFENGKPVIVGKIGKAPYKCWEDTTEVFFRKKAVMQCMSTFPVMVKTEHMKEMREVLAKEQGQPFSDIFMKAPTLGAYCMCQFSIMCNYLWYYHRKEYAWHLQMWPDGNWSGDKRWDSQVSVEYYHKEIKPEEKIPIPRSSIHLRYTITNGVEYLSREPPPHFIEDFIREGLCYSGGFKYCPNECKKWDVNKVHYGLFAFEFYQWFWDQRCMSEQKKHYEIVEKHVQYYFQKKIPVLGVKSTDELCKLIAKPK